MTGPRPVVSILYVNPASSFAGGAERSLADLVSGLDRARFAPCVLCPGQGAFVESLRAAGTEVFMDAWPRHLVQASRRRPLLALARLALAAPGIVALVLRLRRIIRTRPMGLVCTNGIKAHMLAIPAAAGLAPLVWHFRDYPRSRWGRALFRFMGGLATRRIITPSNLVGSIFRKGRARERQVTVYNGVRAEPFDRVSETTAAAARQQLGLTGPGPVIGSVGALVRVKGFGVLIEALPAVLEHFPDARILIVGGKTYLTDVRSERERLETVARRLGLEHRIVFAGFRSDMAVMLHLMDVVVQATLEPEPFGRVLIEAMAARRPVIGAVPGGAVEIIRDGETGVHVPSGDPSALAGAVLRVLGRPEETRRMVDAAWRDARKRFDLAETIRRTESAYEDALARRP